MSTAETTSVPVARSRPRRFLVRAGAVATLFFAGLLISWLCRVCFSANQPEMDPVSNALEPPEPTRGRSDDLKEKAPETAQTRLERADRHFREHNQSAALNLYKKLLAEATGTPAGPLHFRIAVCHESLGNWDKALSAYRATINDEAIVHVHALAQIAQARILIRLQRHAEAKQLLYPIVFVADATQLPSISADARHWLALALSREAVPESSSHAIGPSVVAPICFPVEFLTDLREFSTAPKPKAVKKMEAVAETVVVQSPPDTDKMVAHAVIATRPALDLFDLIIKTAGLRAEWTTQAKNALKDRQFRLGVEQWKVSQFLDALADYSGLVCQQDGDEIRFATVREATPEAAKEFRFNLARHALRMALKTESDHRLGPITGLELGNLEFARGDMPEAMACYQKILREKATSPLVVHANYNLGILHYGLGDYSAARKAFFQSIDLSPGHELAPTALLHVGRMYLEELDLKSAVSNLRRARAISDGSPTQPLATLNLSAALLLGDELRRAREVLLEKRGQLDSDRFRATAALLDGLARLRLARSKGLARAAAVDLVAALAQPPEPTNLGPLDTYMRCQAYRDLGMWSEIATTCEQALPEIRGPLAPAVQWTRGDALLHLQKRAEATGIFQELALRKEGRWTAEARFQLAGMDLQDAHPKECIHWCELLWREQPCADMPAMFRIWGAAFEQLGEHSKAARCFAGAPPE